MTAPLAPMNVVVLYGGDSPERMISLESGAAVADALRQTGHQVMLLDPSIQSVKAFDWPPNAAAVIMLHGAYGEDGQVQAELESLNIPYSGSDQAASKLAFHKNKAKELLVAHQLPTPSWNVVPASAKQDEISVAATNVGYPLVIKPNAQGSSIGVTIVEQPMQLQKAFEAAKQFDDSILFEKAITGEEWTVPILDRQALPAIRISSDRNFFDYSAKYEDDDTKYEVVHQSDSETAHQIAEISTQACESLKTAGVCRVDLIIDESRNPWLLEVNTIPGMTNHSLVPKSAHSLGWSMPELCERILLSALSNRCS